MMRVAADRRALGIHRREGVENVDNRIKRNSISLITPFLIHLQWQYLTYKVRFLIRFPIRVPIFAVAPFSTN